MFCVIYLSIIYIICGIGANCVYGAQFLNSAPLFLSSACFAASLSLSPSVVVVILASIYASL